MKSFSENLQDMIELKEVFDHPERFVCGLFRATGNETFAELNEREYVRGVYNPTEKSFQFPPRSEWWYRITHCAYFRNSDGKLHGGRYLKLDPLWVSIPPQKIPFFIQPTEPII